MWRDKKLDLTTCKSCDTPIKWSTAYYFFIKDDLCFGCFMRFLPFFKTLLVLFSLLIPSISFAVYQLPATYLNNGQPIWKGNVGRPAGGNPYISDTFDDGNGISLQSHTGEKQSNWAVFYYTNTIYINGTNKSAYSTADAEYYNTTGLPSPDYSIKATIKNGGAAVSSNCYISGRMNTSTHGRYIAGHTRGLGWGLMYLDGSGVETLLGNRYGQTILTTGASYTVELRMVGTTIQMYVNNVLATSVTHSGRTSGYAGLEMNGGTGGANAYEVLDYEVNTNVVFDDIPNVGIIHTTLSNGATLAQINAAITAASTEYTNTGQIQVVKLNTGTYSITGSVVMKSGVVLRGDGKNSTILNVSSGATFAPIKWGSGSLSYTSVGIDLASGYTKGSNTLTTTTDHLLNVGDLVVLDQVDSATSDPPMTNDGDNGDSYWHSRDPSGSNPSNVQVRNRSMGQVVRVIATPTATTFKIEIPLYWTLIGSLTPQVTEITKPYIVDSGLEDLRVNNENSGGSDATIVMTRVYKCWVKGVEGIGAERTMLKTYSAYRCNIRNNEFHSGAPISALGTPEGTGTAYATDSAYGLWIEWASALLMENNEIYKLTMAFLYCGQSSGNVQAYNYIHTMYYSPWLEWQPDTLASFHGGHPMFNLIEGNLANGGRMRSDAVWGSSSHIVFFRNKNTLLTDRSNAAWNMALYNLSRYYVFVGNILGGNNSESVYETASVSSSSTTRAVYSLPSTVPTGQRPLRHANWDSVTSGNMIWNGSDDHALPVSLYTDTRPSFYNPDYQWPSIGYDIAPMAPSYPTAGTGTPWNWDGTPPSTIDVIRNISAIGSAGDKNLVSNGTDLPRRNYKRANIKM